MLAPAPCCAVIDDSLGPLSLHLRELCPEGVNIFFDNVGGPVLDAVLDNIAMRARVVICGAVSQYDDMDNVTASCSYRSADRPSPISERSIRDSASRAPRLRVPRGVVEPRSR